MWISATAPKSVNKNVLSLLKKIGIDGTPTHVQLRAEPDAVQKYCFPNVQRKIKRSGGHLVHGWSISESPILIEAEFHGVWRSETGELIDVTPNNEAAIMFILDQARVYDGQQIDNVRLNLPGISLWTILLLSGKPDLKS